jgi:hypothetical protein
MILENLITDHGNGIREEINSDGTIIWYKNDQVHRDDGPAVWKLNGVQQWYKDGKLHREDGPAIITGNEDGTKRWYINGELHREDGPAVETGNGEKRWYINGLLHRDNDAPAIVRSNGTEEWYKDGQLHRDNGPAIIKPRPRNIFSNLSIEEYWYQNGMLHREDGPAIIKLNGEKNYYLNDQEITQKQFEIFKLQESLHSELSNNLETKPKKLKV